MKRLTIKTLLLIPICLFISGITNIALSQSISILCYNIHHANPPSKEAGFIDLKAIAQVINDSNADLVSLQEVDMDVPRSGNIDQAKELAELTNRHFFFAKGIDLDGGEYGVAILSKSPFIWTKSFLLPMAEESEQRVIAIGAIELENGKEVVFSTSHFDLKDKNKISNAEFVLAQAKNTKAPFIFTGDLNAHPESAPIKLLSKELKSVGWGATFPEINPSRQIDYIMVGKNDPFKVTSFQVIEEEYASDHRPIFAILELQ